MGLADSGPGLVAALCARNHWKDLSTDDQQWCLDTLIAEVAKDSDSEDYLKQVANDPMKADRHSAYVLPKLLSKNPDNTVILKAIAKAITHACDQVALWAAEGVGEYLVSECEDLMIRCVGAIAMQANLLDKHRTHGNGLGTEWQSADSFADLHVKAQVRGAFVAGAINGETELESLDLTSGSARHVSVSILAILGRAQNMPLSTDFFVRAAQAVFASWAAERRELNSRRDLTFEHAVMTRLARLALALPPDTAVPSCGPFLDAVEDHPREVASFVEQLIYQEDYSSSVESSFWPVWWAFAERVLERSVATRCCIRLLIGDGIG